jgi:glycosyltransferase involved in cell wall biosynthesis
LPDQPLVSVVIPTFNRGGYVSLAVESALAQTWPEKEVIVVDDGSTDGTGERLRSFGDRIRYRFQQNRGHQGASNAGVAMAGGDFVAFLDSDDLWLPGKLARDMEVLLADPSLGMVCSRMEVIDEQGTRTGALKPEVEPGETLDRVLVTGSALTSSFTIRREVFERVGGLDPSLTRFEDLDLVISVLQEGPIRFLPAPLALYRDHRGNLTKNIRANHLGHYQLARKWVRRFEERASRRIAVERLRVTSRAMARDCLERREYRRALGFGARCLYAKVRQALTGAR